MTDIENDPQLTYADKIAKLLRKAENTESEVEADALNAKAQALMIKYAISEQLLAVAQGKQLQDKIVEETIDYTGIFHRALFNIGSAIARANGCKALIGKLKNATRLYVVGFESDVSNVKTLNASLQVQASTAMQRWFRQQDTWGMSNMDKFKLRREFFFGFADGVRFKMTKARRAGVEQATVAEAERTGDAAQAKVSTDLVLRSKAQQVDDWMDRHYGTSLRHVRGNYSSGGYQARSAGHAAGRAADTNQPRIGGSRREINS